MKHLALILSLIGIAGLGSPLSLHAQGKGRGSGQERGGDSIPAQYRPPAGMCRIWITGVPANQQSAPTDCASAVRNRPPNGRVIFGPELPRKNNVPPTPQSDTTRRRGEPPPQLPRPTKRIPPPGI